MEIQIEDETSLLPLSFADHPAVIAQDRDNFKSSRQEDWQANRNDEVWTQMQ